MSGNLSIREVKTRADLNAFVDFQYEHYRDSEFWVPPIRKDEIRVLHPRYNPAFEFCEVKSYLIYRDNKVVGRGSAIINSLYNQKTGEKFGRICRTEFIDDPEVYKLLLDTMVEWFRRNGMKKIHGPLGFSNLDNQGLLIEGFDYYPSIASVYHHPYYKKHFEDYGFQKENDWVEFILTLSDRAVDKGSRGMQLVMKRYGFELLKIKSKSELKILAPEIFNILNDAFSEIPYVTEMNKKMVDLYIKKYFGILDHRFITVVKKDRELIGFFVGLPNLSLAMKKAGGRLFPFGFIHILRALRKPRAIDMLLTGVLHKYHSSGVAVILVGELQRRMLELGINQMETTGVFETNQNVITNWKNYNHVQHKRRRCFVKDI